MSILTEMEKSERRSPKDIHSRGVENYFTNSLLYQDPLEIDENLQPAELDSDNEADIEPEAEEEYLWELNPLVTSINKLDVNNTANDIGERYINKELDLAFFSSII